MVESEDVKKAEIDRLYKENVSKVYRTALYYVEDHYVAEEIVQEVFLKLYVRRTGCSTHRSASPERMPRATRYDLCRSI